MVGRKWVFFLGPHNVDTQPENQDPGLESVTNNLEPKMLLALARPETRLLIFGCSVIIIISMIIIHLMAF